jgi:hypothetical protein
MSFEAILEGMIDRALARRDEQLARIEAKQDEILRKLPPEMAGASIATAAKVTGWSVSTVRRKLLRGEIPSFGSGRNIRCDLSRLRPLDEDEIAAEARTARVLR